jgi:peptide/nickel transport system substrate-binding protein
VLAVPAEPRVLDPAKASAAVDHNVLSYLGAALLDLDRDGNLVPWLAEDYSVSPDGLTITFHLKEGVTFHNGEPLTAEDFKWTFERIMDPATASPVAGTLLSGVESVDAPDPLTLVLKLSTPKYALLRNLCIAGYLQPLNRKAVEAAGDAYPSNPVGVGPYKIKEVKTGEYVLLERNADYNWAPSYVHEGPWYIGEIKFMVIPDQASQVAALESGQLSGLLAVPTQNWDKFANDPRFQFFEALGGGFIYVTMNLDNPIFADLNVRKALNHAVDRVSIINSVFQGHGIPGHGVFHPGLPGYLEELDESPTYAFNPEKAKELLESAGWKDTDGDGIREKNGKKLEFDFLVINASYFPLMAEVIQAQLLEVGANAKIVTMEQGTAIQNMLGGNYEMGLMQWGWTEDAADILYTTLHSSQAGGGLNFAMYRNEDLDALIEGALTVMDSQEHLRYLAEIQRHVVDNAVQIPLTYTVIGQVFVKELKGITKSTTDPGYTFVDAYFEAPAGR